MRVEDSIYINKDTVVNLTLDIDTSIEVIKLMNNFINQADVFSEEEGEELVDYTYEHLQLRFIELLAITLYTLNTDPDYPNEPTIAVGEIVNQFICFYDLNLAGEQGIALIDYNISNQGDYLPSSLDEVF